MTYTLKFFGKNKDGKFRCLEIEQDYEFSEAVREYADTTARGGYVQVFDNEGQRVVDPCKLFGLTV